MALLKRILLCLVPALLGAAAPAPEPGPDFRVVEVVDGDTVVLDDGSQARLVGIQAPKLPLGRPGFPTWPLAEQARVTLSELALDRQVRLSFGGTRMDRHGRHLAHLHVVDGGEPVWVQGELLRRGMARVYTFPDNRQLASEMLALEREARAARRGIWNERWYAVRDHDRTARDIGSFQLVEGPVMAAARVRDRIYLNFGPDWRSDFTVKIPKPALRAFRSSGRDPLALEGRRIRVRGWIRSENGPMIEATHPEQIEILDE